jgi:hypothetical protein
MPANLLGFSWVPQVRSIKLSRCIHSPRLESTCLPLFYTENTKTGVLKPQFSMAASTGQRQGEYLFLQFI